MPAAHNTYAVHSHWNNCKLFYQITLSVTTQLSLWRQKVSVTFYAAYSSNKAATSGEWQQVGPMH